MMRKLLSAVLALVMVAMLLPVTAMAAGSSQLATPRLNAPAGEAGGVWVTWSAVPGAAQYRVFVKGGDYGSGKWVGIGNTTGTGYVHTAAVSGTQYTYTVRCISADGKSFTSDFDAAGKTISYMKPGSLANPRLNTPTGESGGVKITWSAVPGAAKYRVFVKGGDYGSKWVGLGNTTGTGFVHSAAVSGTQYTYTVRCISADGKSYTSGYDAAGKTITYTKPGSLAAPKLNNPTSEAGGVRVTWNKVSGAAQYRVFVKGGSYGSGKWVGLGNTTGTGYIHSAAVNGVSYTYTVRCISANGKSYTSGYDAAGKTVTYTKPGASGLDTPRLNTPTGESNGVKITWGRVSGAVQYRVFVKGGSYGNSKWVGLGNTTGTSYIHTAAVSGTQYTYTVRCVGADGKSFTSNYDPIGRSIVYNAGTPVISGSYDTTELPAADYTLLSKNNSDETPAGINTITRIIRHNVTITSGATTTTTFYTTVYIIGGAYYYECDTTIFTHKLVKGDGVVAFLSADPVLFGGITKIVTQYIKGQGNNAKSGQYKQDVYIIDGKAYAVSTAGGKVAIRNGKAVLYGAVVKPVGRLWTKALAETKGYVQYTTDGDVSYVMDDDGTKWYPVYDSVPGEYTGAVDVLTIRGTRYYVLLDR